MLALTVVIGVALKIVMGTSVAGTALRTESGIFARLTPKVGCANGRSFLSVIFLTGGVSHKGY